MKAWTDETTRVYKAHFRDFETWCEREGRPSLPSTPGTIGDYLIELVRKKPSYTTVRMRAVAIGQMHEVNGFENPCHHRFMTELVFGARLELGDKVLKPRENANDEVVRQMVTALEDDDPVKLLRNRAIILLSHATRFTRKQLVSLKYDDLTWRPDGVFITSPERRLLTFSDDELCAAGAVHAWMVSAGIGSGALFRAMDRWGNIWPRAVCEKTVYRIIGASYASR